MKFLLDHDVPDAVATMLRREGHQVICLREILPVRTPDPEVMAAAAARDRVVITCNRDDFLRLASAEFEIGLAITGLIILIRRHTHEAECANVAALLRSAASKVCGGISTLPEPVSSRAPAVAKLEQAA